MTQEKKLFLEVKECMELLDKRSEELKLKKREFESQNGELIEHISQLKDRIEDIKCLLKLNAISKYKIDGNKQQYGGIGIRITKSLDYDEAKAFDWAKEHSLCLQLNKKEFESIAKTSEIDFVKNFEIITATFPSKINIERLG